MLVSQSVTDVGEVTYGVSPGDRYVGGPYAYVSRREHPESEFWNQPFGAARRLAHLDGVEGVVAFFREGGRGTEGATENPTE